MTRNPLSYLATSAAIPALFLASACGGDLASGEDPADDPEAAASAGTRVHMMPMSSGIDNFSHPAGAHLNYYGGPVLKNINVIPVYWNSNTQYQSNLSSFYSAFPSSTHYNMLSQYSSIGHGTRGTPYVDNKGTGNFTDAQIHTELNRLFTAGSIPAPNASNYYPVHFPSGVSITAPDGSKSCVVFCAYHGTYVRNGVNVNYGIIPDQGGGCAGGCGSNSQRVNNLTSVSSHELVEATTDPAVGLATTFAPPLAWYDPTYGEIGDICNAQEASITISGTTYVVQKEFSNSANDCITP